VKQLLRVLSLVFIFILVLCLITPKSAQYKVLKVVSSDTLYIDINNNSKTDEDELVKIRDIEGFQETYTANKTLSIDRKTAHNLGYLAKTFTKNKLEGKTVTVKNLSPHYKNHKHRSADIYLEGENFAHTLLKEGYAEASPFTLRKNYLLIENFIAQIKNKELAIKFYPAEIKIPKTVKAEK